MGDEGITTVARGVLGQMQVMFDVFLPPALHPHDVHSVG
jgi:hypothetical protein